MRLVGESFVNSDKQSFEFLFIMIIKISYISEKIGINRTTLLTYLHYLRETGLTHNLFR